jgi:hypothetical protein
MKYDGSVRNPFDQEGQELVMISPESKFEERLKTVCDFLKSIDAEVNDSCGLHVHLDMRNRKAENCYTNLFMSQDLLFNVQPENRRNNQYCRRNTRNVMEDSANNEGRYQIINAEAINKFNTLEIRCHSGTRDYNAISSWVNVLTSIVDAPKKFKKKVKTVDKLIELVEIRDDSESYMRERLVEFNSSSTDTVEEVETTTNEPDTTHTDSDAPEELVPEPIESGLEEIPVEWISGPIDLSEPEELTVATDYRVGDRVRIVRLDEESTVLRVGTEGVLEERTESDFHFTLRLDNGNTDPVYTSELEFISRPRENWRNGDRVHLTGSTYNNGYMGSYGTYIRPFDCSCCEYITVDGMSGTHQIPTRNIRPVVNVETLAQPTAPSIAVSPLASPAFSAGGLAPAQSCNEAVVRSQLETANLERELEDMRRSLTTRPTINW